jgi:thymidylate synthase
VADGKLSCQLYQRSCDVFLGLPFNIASYSLLTHMIASICGLGVGDFIWTGGDTHLYLNHFDQAKTQLKRTPTELPRLIIRNKKESINDFRYDDFELVGYNPQPAIKAQISV